MNLGFMQNWPNDLAMSEPKTYFIEKINFGLYERNLIKRIDYVDALEAFRSKFNSNWDIKSNLPSKIHTIRKDEQNKWKAGCDIKFLINQDLENEFQFAPVVKCVSVQEIEIKEMIMTANNCIKLDDGRVFTVRIDSNYMSNFRIIQLAMNDGFESVEDFFKYFDRFEGKLIHWTSTRY